ncbi:hypothetical protein POM88_023488 [Heracleum sosnowskyi]|uniref:Disease resistance protein n=1 Tax=Heracleum sosnowskyi TaxID=360622 RepID=A0AAD8IJK9_9APIA|nr:hypothetical protein POM88_023488 [Heracleum sosnowskyi]
MVLASLHPYMIPYRFWLNPKLKLQIVEKVEHYVNLVSSSTNMESTVFSLSTRYKQVLKFLNLRTTHLNSFKWQTIVKRISRGLENLFDIPPVSIGLTVTLSSLDLTEHLSQPGSVQNLNPRSGWGTLLAEKKEVQLDFQLDFPERQGILSDNEELLSLIEKVSEDKLLKSKFISVMNLNVIHLRNSKLLEIPDNFSFPDLKMIFLLNLEYIPPSFFERMPALEILDMSDTSIKNLPPSVSKLITLKELLLRRCEHLIDLPNEIGALVNLKVLDISGCRNLAEIPESICSVESLCSVDIRDCQILTNLPEGIRKMRSLQYVYLSGCSSLVDFHVPEFTINRISTTGQANEMEVLLDFHKSVCTLEITALVGLVEKLLEYEFLKSKSVAVRNLKVIHMRNSKLPKIQDNVSFPDVEELLLQPNFDLSCVPSSFVERLLALKVLNMSKTSIKTIPSWVFKFIKLEQLILIGCEHLTEVSDGIGALENLKLLDLSGCSSLFEVPNLFIEQMPTLEVLDLSGTSIKTLPDSVSRLIKLEELRLRHCELLKELPQEIGRLESLRVLDLEGTDLVCLPEELGKLIKLKCLRVSLYDAESYRKRNNIVAIIPRGMLSQLSELEELWINVDPHDIWCQAALEAIMENLPSLRKLKTLKLFLPTAKLLQHLLELEWEDKLSIYQSLSDFNLIIGPHAQRFKSSIPTDLEQEFLKLKKCLKYINGDDEMIKFAEALKYANALYLDRDWTIPKLSIFKLEELDKLKFCLLVDCNKMETIFDGSDFNNGVANRGDNLLSLQYLAIYDLKNLKKIWKGPDVGACVHFLKVLSLHMCQNLNTIFTSTLLRDLVNLREIIVEDCPKIESLITDADSSQLTSEEILPRLKKLTLLYLPQLVTLSSGFSIGPQLVNIVIYDCPRLKRLPLMGVSCKEGIKIKGESKWWNALEWNEPEWTGGQPNYLRCAFSELDIDGNLLNELEPQYGNSLRLLASGRM